MNKEKQIGNKEGILDIDPDQIDFSNPEIVKELFLKLLNACGNVLNENAKLREENQELKDDINRLKGEKGKPNIKPNKEREDDNDISSEKERKKGGKNRRNGKSSKKNNIEIHDTQKCYVDQSILPDDTQFKDINQ